MNALALIRNYKIILRVLITWHY